MQTSSNSEPLYVKGRDKSSGATHAMRILASPAFSNERVNPYNALLYREMQKLGVPVDEYSHRKAVLEPYDIVHFHWPDGYMNERGFFKAWQRIALFVLIITLLKLKGTKVVWTAHNVAPHDAFRPALSQRFMNWFIQRCDGLIFMSEDSKNAFFKQYQAPQQLKYAIIPHGHYRNSYPAAIDQQQAKATLGLLPDKKVLLFFGMIKPYNNVDTLIKVFNQAQLEQYTLVVAGSPETSALANDIKHLAESNPDVHVFLRFIPDNELHTYLSAADIVVLPYKAIFNSGALLLALSFDKPVIAPHIGAMVVLQKQLGEQWIHSYRDDFQTQTLQQAIAQLETAERPAVCPLDEYNWDHLADATVKLYQRL